MDALEKLEVDFHGTALPAVRDRHGTIWISLRRLCDAIGLKYAGQAIKAKKDKVLSRHIATLQIPDDFERLQATVCLDLAFVRGWLFGINANKVNPEIRDQLQRYQEHVYEVINREFAPPSLPESPTLSDEMIAAMMTNLEQQQQLWAMILQEKRRLRALEG